MLIEIIVLILALSLLVISADKFTDGAEKIALALGIPHFIIGVTIVSVGTSLPELATAFFSVMSGDPNASTIIAGNVIGSNVANIALVLGAAIILIYSKRIQWDILKVDLPLLLGTAFFLYFTALDGVFSFNEAVIAFIFYAVYIEYSISTRKKREKKARDNVDTSSIAYVLLGAIGIYFGAQYTVESVIGLANILQISPSLIAVSAVAIGTSLPELVVSVTAARKNNIEMAVGNVTGSNIFNALIVMGAPAMLVDIPIDASMQAIGIPFMIAVTLLLVVVGADKEFGKYEGAMFLILYGLFLALLFGFV